MTAPYILLGDFNAHSKLWGCRDTNRLGEVIEKVVETADLCILNDGSSTYLHPASGSFSAIDLSICSPSIFMDFKWEVHNDQCGSDHFPVFLTSTKPIPQERIPKWQLYKADWPKYNNLCSMHLTRPKFINIEDKLLAFVGKLVEIATTTIPKSSTGPHKVHKPWFNSDCKRAVKERKRALRAFNSNSTPDNLTLYKQARARTRSIIKASKRDSWKEYISKLTTRTPVKKVWDMVRKISGKQYSSTITHLSKADGSKCTERKDIANTLADEFEKNSSTGHYSAAFQAFKANAEKRSISFKSNNTEVYNNLFSFAELEDAIKKSHDTAVGPDDIHYQFLKHLPEESLQLLLDIFNNIWETGIFPDIWREAIIIPIPKPGKDTTNPTNYRPISLTSCLCKTMERLINARLVWFLEKNKFLSPFQSGFRSGRTTTDQLVRLETTIRDAFVRGDHVVSVLFDLEKAYDTTWKYGILKDLHNIGLKGRMPIFINNFLSNRVFKVRLGSLLSEIHSQEMGVPQGCILSVTLFILKINDIVNVIKPGIDKSLFVDHFSISCMSKSIPVIERQLHANLNKIEKWADENGFKFSKTKTVCMHFCQKRKLHPEPCLQIYGSQIPVVPEAKFLGIIFDKKLNFKAHIDYLRAKCQKSLNLLKVVSKMSWGADQTIPLRLYRSLVRSKLDYGCAVFSSARKSHLRKLEPIQNQSLRLCLGAFRTSPIPSLYVEANDPPLYLRWQKLSVQYALKLKSNPFNPSTQTIFHPNYRHFYTSKPNAIRPLGLRIEDTLHEICPDLGSISEHIFPSKPPWQLLRPPVDLSLREFKKDITDPLVFKTYFYQLNNKYHNCISYYTDGSKVIDRVAAAITNGSTSKQIRLPGSSSIYTAELKALMMALDMIINNNNKFFVIFTDSLSSLMALKGQHFHHPYIFNIIDQYTHLLKLNKTVVFAWVPSHVGIQGNEKADTLAKEALGLNISNIKIPHTDFRANVNIHFRDKWQAIWDEHPDNKLYQIQPIVGTKRYQFFNTRREEKVYSRAKIGHTYTTHAYLLKGDDMPQCISCDCAWSVKHILIECVEFDYIRGHYFSVHDLKALFSEIPPSEVVGFLATIGVYAKF